MDEAHQMTLQAANTLLKTLEEPPVDTYLILVLPTLLGCLPTLRSRAQLVRFSLLEPVDLGQVVKAPPWLLSTGRVDLTREILNLDEDLREEGTYGVWSLLLDGDLGGAFQKIKDRVKDREDRRRLLWLWLQMFKATWVHRGRAEEGRGPTDTEEQRSEATRSLAPVMKTNSIAKGQPVTEAGERVIERLSQLSENQLSGLAFGVVQLERDLGSHLEGGLCFENYFYKADDFIRGRGGDLL